MTDPGTYYLWGVSSDGTPSVEPYFGPVTFRWQAVVAGGRRVQVQAMGGQHELWRERRWIPWRLGGLELEAAFERAVADLLDRVAWWTAWHEAELAAAAERGCDSICDIADGMPE